MANWTKKLKRSVKELIGGKNTYMKKKEKDTKTTRTKSVESGLKSAGIDWNKDKPTAKLRKKK